MKVYAKLSFLICLWFPFSCSGNKTGHYGQDPQKITLEKIFIDSRSSKTEIEIITLGKRPKVLFHGQTPAKVDRAKIPFKGGYLIARSPGKKNIKRQIFQMDDVIFLNFEPATEFNSYFDHWVEILEDDINIRKKAPSYRFSGLISIVSNPSGAQLFLEDVFMGETPYKIKGIKTGKYRLEVKQKDYLPWTTELEIGEGENKEIKAVLSPKKRVVLFEKPKAPRKSRPVKEIEGMVYIPSGEFMLGNDHEWWTSAPRHKAFLEGYYIDRYEVSNREYGEFLEATGSPPPPFWNDPAVNQPDLPVVGVSWQDALEYAKWKNKRLPYEEEWEKAAGILKPTKYPWGNERDSRKANLAGEEDNYKGAAPVRAFSEGAGRYGVFNMIGNVREWCFTVYQASYYKKRKSLTGAASIVGPLKGEFRVIRGGSWKSRWEDVSVTRRRYEYPSYKAIDLGFRCAL